MYMYCPKSYWQCKQA